MPAGPKKAPKFVVPVPPPRKPLWDGPCAGGRNGGITFSMLRNWLVCRERFRVRYVLGLQPQDKFNRVIEYGQMWHVCEEALARNPNNLGATDCWHEDLAAYTDKLLRRYPLQRDEVNHWANVCAIQFPIYVEYWAKQPDVLKRTPLLQEQSFDVPYKLPSGRVVRLRGKWDAVDLISGEGADAGIYLQENKTKGDIDEQQLVRQLTMDLQTMIYLVALGEHQKTGALTEVEITGPMETTPGGMRIIRNGKRTVTPIPIRGVRYNVVRRPLSGGEGAIVQRKGSRNVPAESAAEFYNRVKGVIDGTGKKQNGENYPGPASYFMRWKVEVSPSHVDRFRRQCLDPILEQLVDWYEFVTATDPAPEEYGYGIHYRTPYGVGGPLDDYGSEFDAFLDTGSEVGLTRRETLFEELT